MSWLGEEAASVDDLAGIFRMTLPECILTVISRLKRTAIEASLQEQRSQMLSCVEHPRFHSI
jgi:hypothetical protein